MNSQVDLLKAIQERKVEAYEELYHLYYSKLTLFAQTYVYQKDVAEDLVQETFYKLWENAENQRITSSIKSYLYSAVKNKCINHLRHLKVEDKYRQKEMDAVNFAGNYEMVNDELLISKIRDRIEDLPEKCRIAFNMAVLQEMKYKEIAEELDLSINTIKDHIKRAYRILREQRFDDYLKLLICLMIE
ncbi:MAG: RNA polymerase sigma-70 factor [Marinifilum sp.]|nr:RNA polymerase sigma-70 factor [Marinifilum sp.]